jgi:23S rRNA maturation mini-RNase III
MFEAIKNLKPAHRFQALLVIVILSTLSSIATAYMSTDDCSGLANQYNTLIKNYTETMSLNNQLVEDNNQKQKDFIIIKKMLDSLNSFEPEIVKRTTIKNKEDNPIVYDNHQNNNHTDTILVAASPIALERHSSKTITTETTVTKIGKKQKSVLSKVYDVLKKHEK